MTFNGTKNNSEFFLTTLSSDCPWEERFEKMFGPKILDIWKMDKKVKQRVKSLEKSFSLTFGKFISTFAFWSMDILTVNESGLNTRDKYRIFMRDQKQQEKSQDIRIYLRVIFKGYIVLKLQSINFFRWCQVSIYQWMTVLAKKIHKFDQIYFTVYYHLLSNFLSVYLTISTEVRWKKGNLYLFGQLIASHFTVVFTDARKEYSKVYNKMSYILCFRAISTPLLRNRFWDTYTESCLVSSKYQTTNVTAPFPFRLF